VLYLDASALVKRYVREAGSDIVIARFATGERLYTSVLSYAEVEAALGRKYRTGGMGSDESHHARERFRRDFVLFLNIVELDVGTLAAVPSLVDRFPIRGADAVHLSAALWLRDMMRLVPDFSQGEVGLEFGAADENLKEFARHSGLTVLSL